jgi:hypothetical protein
LKSRFAGPLAGPIIGGLMALVMIALLVMIYTNDDSPYTLYLAALIAMAVLGPLLLANLVMTIVYLLRKTVPGKTFAWMWLPPLLVLLTPMQIEGLRHQRKEAFAAAHPDIREVHVNLSGRSLWLDPDEAGQSSGGRAELPGKTPGKFLALTRYSGGEDKMSAYAQARIADSYREMRVFSGLPADTPPTILPVRLPTPFPAVNTFLDRLTFKGGESSVIEYAYYHYADHVDIVPTINLSGSQAMDLWGSDLPVVDFHLANLTPLPIARLEINGQGISLGDDAFAPENAETTYCTSRNFSGYAITRLDKPLTVRWQLAQANPVWHEATVTVAGFGPGRINGRIRSTSVDLFFQKDGSLAAEASQLIDQPGDKLALRVHSPVPLLHEAPCGRTPDRFTDAVKIIRE